MCGLKLLSVAEQEFLEMVVDVLLKEASLLQGQVVGCYHGVEEMVDCAAAGEGFFALGVCDDPSEGAGGDFLEVYLVLYRFCEEWFLVRTD